MPGRSAPDLRTLFCYRSCRTAVARLISHELSRGERPCSAETWQRRAPIAKLENDCKRNSLSNVARHTGTALDSHVDSKWLGKERRVQVYDASTVTMPDAHENQLAYRNQRFSGRASDFSWRALRPFFSLACGAVIDLGICRYAGKGQTELTLLQTLINVFQLGDVMLADRLMCAWKEMVTLKQRGVDSVGRFTIHRKADFRKERRSRGLRSPACCTSRQRHRSKRRLSSPPTKCRVTSMCSINKPMRPVLNCMTERFG